MDTVFGINGIAVDSACHAAGPDGDGLLQKILANCKRHVLSHDVMRRLIVAGASDAETIINILEENPILAARILGMVNAAAMGIRNEVTSIRLAVSLLGVKSARSMAIAFAMRILMDKLNLPAETAACIWANSLRKACAARRLCEVVDPAQTDTAYAMALLQDIGLPMLMSIEPEFYESWLEADGENTSLASAEYQHFGIDHIIVGSSLLSQWGTAETLWMGVMQHHHPPMDEDIEAAAAWSTPQLATFFAGLLPHLGEPMCDSDLRWAQAIYTRFLTPHYASLATFLLAVDEAVLTLSKQASFQPPAQALPIARIMDELAGDNIEMASNIFRLEAVLNMEQRGAEALRNQAFTDPMTKLLNRRGFMTLMERRYAAAVENGYGLCCVVIDVDDFKTVNDTHSHAAGDQLLRGVSILLRQSVPSNAVLGRFGGDEFGAVLVDLDEPAARELARTLSTRLDGRRVRLLPNVEVTLHASIGVAYFNRCDIAKNHDDVLRITDEAMYQRKKNGKHGVFFVNASDPANVLQLERSPRSIARKNPRPIPRPWPV